VYDAAGQLTSLSHSSTSGVLDGYGITRDVRGNPTQVDTTTGSVTTSSLYTYDAVSRLRTECYPVTGVACTAKSPRNAYTYDLVGNRATESARTVAGTKATTVSTDYTYDAAYQLLTKSVGGTATVTNTWSPNGALATSTTPTGTQTYTTDLTDELTSLTLENGSTVGYTTDAQGNRTSRTVNGLLDATWAWDDLSSLPMRIGEYDPTGTLTTGWLADPTSSTGASLAQTSGGVSSWLLSDPFANTVATVSTTGNTVSGTRSMDAFGVERTTATGSLADASVGFAGQYLDTATGLYDMRARDYDPTSGRFNATDPVDVSTGTPYFAGYSYAYNNPLTGGDPSGLWSDPDWGQLAKGVFANAIVSTHIVKGVVEFSLPQGKKKLIDSMYNTWDENGRGLDDAWTSANVNLNPMYAAVASSSNAYDNYHAGRPGDAMVDLYTAASITSMTVMGVKAPVESVCAKLRTAAAGTAARVFSSGDLYVADAANAIEQAFPGRVQGVNSQVKMPNGLSREVDVDLGDLIVQVKSGNARGLTGQIQATAASAGRTTIGYAPAMPGQAWLDASRQGIPIARTPDELVSIVKELGS